MSSSSSSPLVPASDEPSLAGLAERRHTAATTTTTTTTTTTETLELAFFRPEHVGDAANAKDSRITRLTVWHTDGPYSHVELLFVRDNLSCSVISGCKPHLREKTYGGIGYDFMEITVSAEQYARMLRFAGELVDDLVGFNSAGAWLNFLRCMSCCPITGGGRYMFCSQLVTTVLQHGDGVVPQSWRPEQTSPNDLYRRLRPQFVISVKPSVQRALADGSLQLSMVFVNRKKKSSSAKKKTTKLNKKRTTKKRQQQQPIVMSDSSSSSDDDDDPLYQPDLELG